MAVCGSCGADNPAEFRFCGSCGTALGAPGCPSCGFSNPPGQRFCGQCGTPLSEDTAPARTSSPGERKLATVLFADVVGFTSLSENADPEAVARTVDAAFRRMAEVVESYGGTVDKYIGDALMAVFGVPVAHDDDAERAVAAALAMRELGGDLAFSIGINSGEVMATAVGRDGDVTVIGDAVNVAARLEKTAGGGEVLVGPLTAELAAGGVLFRERQPVLLKGKRDPVPVWEVLGLRHEAAPAERLPLVGREDELAFLRAQWRRVVRDGRAAVVLVTAEAGMGKTRLLEELAAEVADEAAVARARYPAYGRFGGPQVAADIAEQLGEMGEREIDVRVRSVAGEVDPSLRELDPEAVKHEQLWAFRRYLESKAAEQPLLIVIDDIHRSGDQTLSLLGELMARVVEVPVMLALVGRPEPGEWLVRFPGATTVRLAPLSPADSAAFVGGLLSDGSAADDTVASLVQRGTGNPLYLRELVAVVCCREGPPVALPPNLQAILAARLDALRPEEKGAIQRVSVLGDAATEAQVATLGLTQAAVPLGSLVATGLLRQRADACYEVADPLLREVAYETLPRQLRGEWHRRAAGAATDAVDRARQLERAAGYLTDDDDVRAEAAEALRDAGHALIDAHRPADGISLLLRAVDLGLREPDLLLRLASTLANTGRGDEARTVLSHLDEQGLTPYQQADRQHIDAVSHMFTSPEDAPPVLDAVAEQWAALGEKAKEGWAWSNKGVVLFNSGHMPEAAVALERALGLFAESGEEQGRLAAQSFIALIRPDDPWVSGWLEEALASAERAGDRTNQTNVLVLLSWHHALRSRYGGSADMAVGERYAERVASLAADLGFAEFEVHGLCLGAIARRFTGRIDEARDMVERARRCQPADGSAVHHLVEGVGFLVGTADDPALAAPPFVASHDPVGWMAWLAQIEALVLAGRIEEAEPWLGLADAEGPQMGALNRMVIGIPLGLALSAAGRHTEARPLLEEALGSAEALRSTPGVQAAQALLAEVVARTGEHDEAERLLQQAGDAAPDGVAAALALRARAVLGDEAARAELGRAATALAAPVLQMGTD